MPGKQAKMLSPDHVDAMLAYALHTRYPRRNRAIVLLSVRAGLRASEIAKLTWDMLIDPSGQVSNVIELRDHIAKNGSGRRIPLHPELRAALVDLLQGRAAAGRVICSERGDGLRPISVIHWFAGCYRSLGLQGCSSHSGRRTFITRAARAVHRVGGSLRDVQQLAGHRSIQTTQRYIDGDTDAQRRLIAII